jgi:hypothetical protein
MKKIEQLHGKPNRRARGFAIPNQWVKRKIPGNFRLV